LLEKQGDCIFSEGKSQEKYKNQRFLDSFKWLPGATPVQLERKSLQISAFQTDEIC